MQRFLMPSVSAGMMPMFPAVAAEGLFSLRPGEDCYAMSVCAVLDEAGDIAEYEVMHSVVRPAPRMTYEEVDAALALPETEQRPELAALHQACLGLCQMLLCAHIHTIRMCSCTKPGTATHFS